MADAASPVEARGAASSERSAGAARKVKIMEPPPADAAGAVAATGPAVAEGAAAAPAPSAAEATDAVEAPHAAASSVPTAGPTQDEQDGVASSSGVQFDPARHERADSELDHDALRSRGVELRAQQSLHRELDNAAVVSPWSAPAGIEVADEDGAVPPRFAALVRTPP